MSSSDATERERRTLWEGTIMKKIERSRWSDALITRTCDQAAKQEHNVKLMASESPRFNSGWYTLVGADERFSCGRHPKISTTPQSAHETRYKARHIDKYKK
jgi:hypothetical protein